MATHSMAYVEVMNSHWLVELRLCESETRFLYALTVPNSTLHYHIFVYKHILVVG